ncbi:hypothetical protein [Collimonas sp. OK242]|uniref:hypothetical protein n=1 Tax=Collimonas sp. OK242 TaxID=1798195 RepID=UPI00115FB4A9|nr:hypothetical protein [Collimonas sp. OK242]
MVTVEARSQGQLVNGATCKLQNTKGIFYVTSPGTVSVHRSRDDLIVQCEKENIKPGLAQIKSSVKGMTFGNILLGGVVGAVVDQSSGAAFDYPAVIMVLMGENGANRMPTTAHTTSPANPIAPPAANIQATPGSYVERQLTGEEMRTHFMTLGSVSGHNPSGAKMLYEIDQNGGLEARNLDKGGGTMGSYEIKEAENKICIGIYGGSNWRVMQDCYRLYQVGADMFAMRSTTDKYFFTYIKPQYTGENNAFAAQTAATPSASHENAAPAATEFTGNKPSVSLPAANVAPALHGASASELPAEQIGQYSYQSEHIARTQACATAPHAVLSAKGPGFESYTVSCDNGDSIAMRCDFGQCRVLR